MKNLFAVVALALIVAFPVRVEGQTSGVDSRRPQLTRIELQAMLDHLDQLAASSENSADVRAKARNEAEIVRGRLAAGDIRVGDQISLVVEGEDSLSRTFTVQQNETLTLPGIGDLSLRGVLRSELERHLTDHISRYIRDPVVHAHSLLRITISGSVVRPGFYAVGADRLLSDAIMEAGGPAAESNLQSIRIERAGKRIWEGDYLQQAIAEGRTLDQLSLQAGDQVVVPARRAGMSSQLVSIMGGAASLLALLVTILR